MYIIYISHTSLSELKKIFDYLGTSSCDEVDEYSPKHRENCINHTCILGFKISFKWRRASKKMHETASSLQTPPSTTTYPSDSHVPSQMEINQQNLRNPVTLIHPLATKTRHIFATLLNGRFLPTLSFRVFGVLFEDSLSYIPLETWTPNGGVWVKNPQISYFRLAPRLWLIGMSDWDGWKWLGFPENWQKKPETWWFARRSFPALKLFCFRGTFVHFRGCSTPRYTPLISGNASKITIDPNFLVGWSWIKGSSEEGGMRHVDIEERNRMTWTLRTRMTSHLRISWLNSWLFACFLSRGEWSIFQYFTRNFWFLHAVCPS